MSDSTTAPAAAGQSTDPATTPPAGDPAAASTTPPDTGAQDADAEPPTGDPKAAEGKTFTQADVDRMINDRLERDRKTWGDKEAERNKKLAAALGLAEDDTVDPAKALEDAQGATVKAVERADRAEAKALALAAGVKPERVERFVKLCDLSALSDVDHSDEAKVSAALKSAVDSALEDVPEFKGNTVPAASGGDRAGSAPQGVTVEQFRDMDVNERTKLHQSNPGLYKQLNEQAKAGA